MVWASEGLAPLTSLFHQGHTSSASPNRATNWGPDIQMSKTMGDNSFKLSNTLLLLLWFRCSGESPMTLDTTLVATTISLSEVLLASPHTKAKKARGCFSAPHNEKKKNWKAVRDLVHIRQGQHFGFVCHLLLDGSFCFFVFFCYRELNSASWAFWPSSLPLRYIY